MYVLCHHWVMDWNRLARAIVDRRVELGFRSRPALARHSKMSLRVIADLETAARDNYDPVTIARLEQALEWPSGRVRQFLRAADPQRLTVDTATGATLDPAGRELITELDDLIRLMSPDGHALDEAGREAGRKLLRGVVEILTELAGKTRRDLDLPPQNDGRVREELREAAPTGVPRG
jgi:predicted transcriptional regulator